MKKKKFWISEQRKLWNYLKEDQKRRVAEVLKPLKRGAQESVCVALVDYIETGVMQMPEGFLESALCEYLTNKNSKYCIIPLKNFYHEKNNCGGRCADPHQPRQH